MSDTHTDAEMDSKDVKQMQINTDDGSTDAKVLSLTDSSKASASASYAIFPGVELIYFDVNARCCSEEYGRVRRFIEIDHCLEGRLEYEDGGKYYYLSEGDLAVSLRTGAKEERCCPLGHFRGISVRIDIDEAPEDMSAFLDGVSVKPKTLYEKFCSENRFYVLRESREIEHIFSELYRVPENIKIGYCRIKFLELMLFLNNTEAEKHTTSPGSLTKVRLAKDAGKYIAERMEKKVTVNELASHFHVSESQLKNCFKAIYGMSVHAYIREQKMRTAAGMLAETDIPVLEIAGRFGYDNGSKFAKAFREVTGKAPNAYRLMKTKDTQTEQSRLDA